MDRYEFKDSASQKFWEVAVVGETLTVRFGKIGTDGQTKAKAFADAAAAEKEKAKLVKEKTGKGYVAAGQSATPAPVATAASVKPAAAPKPKKAAAPAQAAETVADTSPSAPSPQESDPPATLPQVPVETRRLLNGTPLPTRTRPGKSMTAAEAWAQLVERLPPVLAACKTTPRILPGAIRNAPPRTMTVEKAVEWLEALAEAGDRWPQNEGRDFDWAKYREQARIRMANLYLPFFHWLVPSFGAGLAIDAACMRSDNTHAWVPIVTSLRSAMTSASSEDYEAGLAWYPGEHDANSNLASLVAFILADDRPEPHALQAIPVLQEAFENMDYNIYEGSALLLVDAPQSAMAKAWRDVHQYGHRLIDFTTPDQMLATMAATAQRFGESPLPAFKMALEFATADERTTVACAILDTHEDDALSILLPHLHEKPIRAAIDRAFDVYPCWMVQRCLASLGGGRVDPVLRGYAMRTIERHGVDTVRAWAAAAGGRIATYFETLVVADETTDAELQHVPPFLLSPPWRGKRTAAADIVLNITPKDVPFAYTGKAPRKSHYYNWGYETPDKLLENIQICYGRLRPEQIPREPVPTAADGEQALAEWFLRNLDHLDRTGQHGSFNLHSLQISVHGHFDSLALMVWERVSHQPWKAGNWILLEALPTMMARFGAKVAPAAIPYIQADPVKLFSVVEHMDSTAIAPLVAHTLQTPKRLREPARAWLRAYTRTALMALLPIAVGPKGTARDEAEFAIRWLRTVKPEAVTAAIADYADTDPQFTAAIGQVLTRDPMSRVPAKAPKLPAWLIVSNLPKPKLKTGGALPDEAMTALVEMLSFVNPDEIYAGVALIREACTPASLAAFAWALFSAWLVEGAPAKDAWAFRAAGWFGDDECARQLTRLVRKWPGEAAHARAVTGLDVLADIGTDVALLNLNGIAEKLKFKGLQDRARDKIAAIAEARELSPEELADRLVPDLDLDERGGLDLDFGPRQFRAGFDEFLKPWVKDANGVRLKDLPKPIKSDDAEKSAEAVKKWAALKKDARAVASLQLTRLENMLVTGRRAKPDVFQLFFAAHPLIRHLAQRLVWGVYDTRRADARPLKLFRITEDLTFTDCDDNPVAIDLTEQADGLIGLAHPLHMNEAEQANWGALFGDYEIAQPFPQLGRETYALTPEEKAATRLTRFENKIVEAKRLRGLSSRGWRLGHPQDGGGITWLEWPVTLINGTKLQALLHLEGDCLIAGMAAEENPKQPLGHIALYNDNDYYSAEPRSLGEMDAVTASEILRSVTILVESSAS